MKTTNNIRIERARHRLTQSDLAKEVGCSRQTIYSIENGKFNPSITVVFRILKFLNTLKSDENQIKVEDLFQLVKN